MNDRITLGAAVLMAALILAALVSRWYVRRESGGDR